LFPEIVPETFGQIEALDEFVRQELPFVRFLYPLDRKYNPGPVISTAPKKEVGQLSLPAASHFRN
jgi:hypothetical protein